jgi:simple sugar transport system ATP-binding protein
MSTASAERLPSPDPAAVRCRIGARGIGRSFGPVRANVDVNISVRPGTIHAVVGENGAGKSTVMRMLYGLDRPDTGHIVINDEDVMLTSPRQAIARGIGLVQQELAVIPELTLLENLVLGDERARLGRIDWNADAARTSIAIQQQVEILRLVYRGADVLILDEPTAVLAPAQAEELLELISSLRDAGRTIIFISHKLDEVIGVADAITVLRAGRTIDEMVRGEIDRDGLAAMIVGDSEIAETSPRHGTPGDVVLRVHDVGAKDDRGIARLDGVGFEVRSGEILGVAAVAGNGQEELAELLIGIRATTGGDVTIDGRSMRRMNIRRRRLAGMGYVSADRKHEGLALTLSLADNSIATPALGSLARAGWFRRKAVTERVQGVLSRAAVRFGTTTDAASSLSGGNQQRVVIGRETIGKPRILVASQPTRGVDIRGIGYIHQLLRQARDEGAAIVLFSEELDELRELSDRILVLHRGRVVGTLPAGSSRSKIGALMLGDTKDGNGS